MTRTYRILDAYCCDGGATAGYRAAFEAADLDVQIVGVDIAKHSAYCGDGFVQADAVKYIHDFGYLFDFIHASPPCQGQSAPTLGTNAARNAAAGRAHPRLIRPTRLALQLQHRPYVIENVPPAVKTDGLRPDVRLCGEMFDLGVLQHRVFEIDGFAAPQPPHRPHRGYVRGWRHGVYRDGPYVAAYGEGGGKATVPEMQKAKRIDWTDDHEALREAIPPAYTEWIGRRLIEHLEARDA